MSGLAWSLSVQIPGPFDGSPQWTAIPTKSVWASARAAVLDGEICEARPSTHSREPSPKTLVMSPVGSVAVTLTCAAAAWAFASGAARSTPVPAAPAPPTFAIVASSLFRVALSRTIVWPVARPLTLVTLMFVAPAAAAAARLVGAGEVRRTIALLFSRTVLATPTLPTSQPARVYGTHGAGALRTAPVPPRDAGSALIMLKFESAEAVGGVFAGLPPSVLSVQYLNEDEKPTDPSGRKYP